MGLSPKYNQNNHIGEKGETKKVKKPKSRAIGYIAVLVLFLLLVIVVINSSSKDKKDSNNINGTVEIGQEARLFHKDGGLLPVGIDVNSLKELNKALIAKDEAGIKELERSGWITTVMNNTRVLVLDKTIFYTEVRILEGLDYQKKYWVPSEWVVPLEEKPLISIDQNISVLNYEIIEKSDYSLAGIPRMGYTVLLNIDFLPTEEQMKSTANEVWEKYGGNVNEFSVWLCMPETDSERYGIATFNKKGMVSFTVNDLALYDTKWSDKKLYIPSPNQ